MLILIVPGEVTSVYVRNLPANVTEAEIDQEFKNFGRIKPDGIFIRVRKVAPHSCIKLNVLLSWVIEKRQSKNWCLQEIGVCYAFVEFEDIIGVQNALQVCGYFMLCFLIRPNFHLIF